MPDVVVRQGRTRPPCAVQKKGREGVGAEDFWGLGHKGKREYSDNLIRLIVVSGFLPTRGARIQCNVFKRSHYGDMA